MTLQTCNVYGMWVTLYCISVQIFMVTCASYRLYSYSLFRNILREAICCCLHLTQKNICGNKTLLLMYNGVP